MAPTSWLLPWWLLLLFILTSCFLSGTGSTTPFPKDLEPINVVSSEQSYHFPGFQGLLQDNDTLRLGLDFQRLLRINHMLYIAARDHVFAVNLTTASEQFVPQLKLTWRSKDVSKCTVRGKNSDECYNYIKVLVPRNDETLFACGTNAFNPTCRNYQMASLEQIGEEVVGQARCPFESGQSNVGLFAGGDFYSATMTDFLASDAVIYRSLGDGRPVLRTVKYDSKWLREPHFLHAIDYGNYVYFFLSEMAVEYTTLGKVVFSRVARVCKNDNGGSPRVLERYWTSFLKARLNCSVPGDSFFYFDVLQSLTNVLQINQRPAVVGVFTTQANSIPGSAACAFYMDDIERVFNGRFKEQRTSDMSWTPVPEEQVPRPRPGMCAGEGTTADYKSSVQFPDETLTFIKSYPLMDEAVPSVNDRPCFTRTSSRSKLTQIVVDVSAGPYKDRAVMFLGSEDGRVLKVLASTHPNDSFGSKLLEDIDVYNPSRCDVQGQEDRRVLGLELDKDHHALFVAFSSCVVRVPLSRCARHGACKTACLASRDPYCIWLRTGSCANMAPGFKAGFEQDIEGDHVTCSVNVMAVQERRKKQCNDPFSLLVLSSPGVRRLPEPDQRTGANVHYTLLIACVLVAFFLGAILSGRSPRRRCRTPCPTPPTRLTAGESRELSGLPTPDSTPELPIKNMKALRQRHYEKNQNFNNAKDSHPQSGDGLPKRLDAPVQTSTCSSSSSSSSNNPTSSTSLPSSSSSSSSTPLQQQVIPERPGGGAVAMTRHHSQRHSLIKMGSGGGAVPRHHSFNQRGAQHAHFLARMNTNSSCNVPGEDGQRPLIAGACLTRQHSYSEGPHVQRAPIVRRTVSLKPQVPPKPLFLPNAATSPAAEAGKYKF
uniref:Sema domain-containing protein n=1 Tax=Mola mola TaxID=94237 RepID=A0A3Q3X2Z9_MOLML